jgi:hypothetical protein
MIIIVIFITGLHNKPHGGASVASAAGALHHKKEKKGKDRKSTMSVV